MEEHFIKFHDGPVDCPFWLVGRSLHRIRREKRFLGLITDAGLLFAFNADGRIFHPTKFIEFGDKTFEIYKHS